MRTNRSVGVCMRVLQPCMPRDEDELSVAVGCLHLGSPGKRVGGNQEETSKDSVMVFSPSKRLRSKESAYEKGKQHHLCVSRKLVLAWSMAHCTSFLGITSLSQCDGGGHWWYCLVLARVPAPATVVVVVVLVFPLCFA